MTEVPGLWLAHFQPTREQRQFYEREEDMGREAAEPPARIALLFDRYGRPQLPATNGDDGGEFYVREALTPTYSDMPDALRAWGDQHPWQSLTAQDAFRAGLLAVEGAVREETRVVAKLRAEAEGGSSNDTTNERKA